MATFSVPRPVVNPPSITVPGNIGPPENNFSFGRSQFDGIRPGTPQILNVGSNWGRIRSVGKKKCLDLTLETNFPVTANCSIFDVSKNLKIKNSESEKSSAIETF